MSRKLKRKENYAKRTAHNANLESGKEESLVEETTETTTPTEETVGEIPGSANDEELAGDPSTTEATPAEANPLDVDGDGDVDAADVAAVANAAAAESDKED